MKFVFGIAEVLGILLGIYRYVIWHEINFPSSVVVDETKGGGGTFTYVLEKEISRAISFRNYIPMNFISSMSRTGNYKICKFKDSCAELGTDEKNTLESGPCRALDAT